MRARFRLAPRLAAACLVLAARAAAAHDFWLEPASFRPAPGERVAVHLRVGDAFPGEPVPRMPARIERFALVGEAGEREVVGLGGSDPAGLAVAAGPGLHSIVYDSNHARITLDGESFERHLAEQGLERVSALRRERGQSAAAATEIFSRCAKALLAVAGADGSVPAGGHDRRLGLPLELVPEADPYALRDGGRLPVALLFHGEPVAGAWVEARSKERTLRVSGRTDAAGRVTFELPGGGFWLVKAVHMAAAPAGSGADWESWWASLTFEIARDPRGNRVEAVSAGPR